MAMKNLKKKNKTSIRRARWEEEYHKDFDYKQKTKMCQECGETNNRHTYTCTWYDTTER